MSSTDWATLLAVDGFECRPSLSASELDNVVVRLCRPLPGELRRLCQLSDGVFDSRGQYFPLWPADTLIAENERWALTGAPMTLVAVGDDGAGDFFGMEPGDEVPSVLHWSPMDAEAYPLADSLAAFGSDGRGNHHHLSVVVMVLRDEAEPARGRTRQRPMDHEVPMHRAPPRRRLLPGWPTRAQSPLSGRSSRRHATSLPSRRMTCGVVKRVSAGAAAISLLLAACGCGRDSFDSAGRESGATALPFETAQNWVTYADYLVEVTIVSEQPIPTPTSSFPATASGPSIPATGSGDGFLGRQVTAATISPPVWGRPTLAHTRVPPASITLHGGGWVVHGTDKKPSKLVDQTRPEIGRHYLAAITYANISIAGGDGSGPTEWLCLELLPFDHGVVGDTPAVSGHSMPKSFEGKPAAEVAAIMIRTPADPAAAPYMAEDPVKRYQDVARDTQPSGTPAPGEY